MLLAEWIRQDMAEVSAILDALPNEAAETALAAILDAPRIFVVGQGRSGLILRMFAMRLMQIGLQAHVVGDATTPAIAPGDLLIALSGSGRTEGVTNMAAKARSYGAQVLAITTNATSPLAQAADRLVLFPAESVKVNLAVATRLPLANALEQAMAIYLDCLGAMLAERRGQDNAAMMRRHANLE